MVHWIKQSNYGIGQRVNVSVQTQGSDIFAMAVIEMNQQQQTTTPPMSSKFSSFFISFVFKNIRTISHLI